MIEIILLAIFSPTTLALIDLVVLFTTSIVLVVATLLIMVGFIFVKKMMMPEPDFALEQRMTNLVVAFFDVMGSIAKLGVVLTYLRFIGHAGLTLARRWRQ